MKVVAFAAAVPLLMRLNIRRLQQILEPARPPAGASADAVDVVVRHLELARRVGSPFVRSGCLTRGLTLYYFLRKSGVDVSLSFGMTRIDGVYSGHCWLTRDGVPFLERVDPRPLYVQMLSIPQPLAGPADRHLPRARDLVRP